MYQPSSPLLIAQMDTPHRSRGGDFFYRTLSPGRALAQHDGVHVLNLDNIHHRRGEILRAADVLILNAVCDADLLPILKQRKADRRLTIYEINDDINAVPPWNPVHSFFARQDRRLLFRRLAHACDAVQYSAPHLRELYGFLNPHGAVFANHLERTAARKDPDGLDLAPGTLVIGWGGSHGHREDMAAVAGPLSRWIAAHDAVALHLMAPPEIVALFAGLPGTRLRVTPPGTIDDYYRFVRTLDIGLAPLLDTGFNRSRSDVKFLEYAGHGVVPLLQDLLPYRDSVRLAETGFLFRDPDDLLRVLDMLLTAPAVRRDVAAAALRYVQERRLMPDHAADRLRFYDAELRARGHAPRPLGEIEAQFRELTTGEGIEVHGRHGLLLHGRYEAALYQGLLLAEREDTRAAAAAQFQAAARLSPGSYQPLLCLGTAAGSEDLLSRAVRSGPSSIQAQLALGMHRIQRGDPESGMQHILRAMELYPEYEIPYLCAAHALRQMGAGTEVQRFEAHAARLMEPLYDS